MSIERFYLGLDVSTAFTGISVLRADKSIHACTAVGFKGCENIFEKADIIKAELEKLNIQPYKIAIEEPLLGFSSGKSSAKTITTLMKFNGIVSYIAKNLYNEVPIYINATHARKVCGIKMQKRSICGKSQKDQVWDWMSMHDLKDIQWPLKKNGDVQDWAKDACDSYVIVKALILENP